MWGKSKNTAVPGFLIILILGGVIWFNGFVFGSLYQRNAFLSGDRYIVRHENYQGNYETAEVYDGQDQKLTNANAHQNFWLVKDKNGKIIKRIRDN